MTGLKSQLLEGTVISQCFTSYFWFSAQHYICLRQCLEKCYKGRDVYLLWLHDSQPTEWLKRLFNIRNLAWKFFAQPGRLIGWLAFGKEGNIFLPYIVLCRKGWTVASWQLFPGGRERNGCVGGLVCGEGVVLVVSECVFFVFSWLLLHFNGT